MLQKQKHTDSHVLTERTELFLFAIHQQQKIKQLRLHLTEQSVCQNAGTLDYYLEHSYLLSDASCTDRKISIRTEIYGEFKTE